MACDMLTQPDDSCARSGRSLGHDKVAPLLLLGAQPDQVHFGGLRAQLRGGLWKEPPNTHPPPGGLLPTGAAAVGVQQPHLLLRSVQPVIFQPQRHHWRPCGRYAHDLRSFTCCADRRANTALQSSLQSLPPFTDSPFDR